MENHTDQLPVINLHPEPQKRGYFRIVIFTLLIVAIFVFIFFFLNRTHKVLEQPVVTVPTPEFIADKTSLLANFSYQGKPIHPNCISESQNADGEADQYDPKNVPSNTPVNLVDCSSPKGGEYDEESLMYFFPSDDDDQSLMPSGYVQYSPILQKGNIFVIKETTNGGGTGIFDGFDVVEKNGDTIINHGYINVIEMGDRCNGGLADDPSASKDGIISYVKNLTPFDLIEIGDLGTKLEAYKDLENSAASCIGVREYTYNFDTNSTDATVVNIGDPSVLVNSKTGKIKDEKGWTDRYKYQSCFNKVYNSYIDQDKTTLDQEGIEAFTSDFMKTCVNKK